MNDGENANRSAAKERIKRKGRAAIEVHSEVLAVAHLGEG
jgi:hypothetical protein